MGLYINPPDMSKEAFLETYGKRLPMPPSRHREYDAIVVCLVDNGMFTAAAIADSQRELEVFVQHDGRYKEWYHVPLVYLEPYLHGYTIEE